MIVRTAPLEAIRIATCVRSLNGAASATPTATTTAAMAISARRGSAARIADSVRAESAEISRRRAADSPTSASTTGMSRYTVAAVKSPNASGPRPRVIATNVKNPTSEVTTVPTAWTSVFAARRTVSEPSSTLTRSEEDDPVLEAALRQSEPDTRVPDEACAVGLVPHEQQPSGEPKPAADAAPPRIPGRFEAAGAMLLVHQHMALAVRQPLPEDGARRSA